MFDQNESVEVTRDLLIALGIEIQRGTNLLIDQETKSQLSFEGKFIKANADPDKALYISEYDVKLDPLNPKCTKIMERLFGKFLDDASSEFIQNIPEVLSYFFDKSEPNPAIKDDPTKYRLTIKFADGTSWIGNWYLNKILCYDEAIFSIDGTFDNIDLRIYDIEQDEWENM